MSHTAADILIDGLTEWDVDTVFGLPGDGIDGVMEALRRRRDEIRFVQVRHEEAAAFMACAWAKYTGRLGVCLATSGPGGIHLLNGLYDAKLDHQPVLAITGHSYHDLIDTFSQQDVNLDRLFEDVAAYNTRIMGAAHVANVVELACRTALSQRTVAHLNFPVDLQIAKSDHASKRNVPHHTSSVRAHGERVPCEDDLARAARVLDAGEKIAILAGQGALGAGDELERIAERLGAPIVKALLGKAVVPDDSPFTTGGIGLLGTRASQEAMEHCDTLLIVGSSFPYLEFYPRPGQARAVQIDVEPARIGLRYPVEVGLVGDARRTLVELERRVAPHDGRFLERARHAMREWRELMDERASRSDLPMKPQVVAAELGKRLTDDAIVSCDSGTVATWFARHVSIRRGQMASLSGTLASMGNGLPYTIAAQIAYPGRQCVAFVGDGGFTMLMGEFATAVKYRLPIKVVVLKNDSLAMIKWEQMVMLGNPEFACALQPIDFAAFARACGGTAFTVDHPEKVGAVIAQALGTPGPVLVEAVVDANEPPMPPKVSLDQATKLAEALIKGTPNRGRIALTVLSDTVRELT